MSTAKLNIWVTQTGDPCRITTKTHFVYVLHCNGDILKWCKDGKPFEYVGIPTKCGHLELEIPPGCYIVGAVVWPRPRDKGLSGQELGNVLTHIGIVRANCGDHVCVTLFEPSLHVCGTWLGAAINTHVATGGGPGGVLTAEVINAMKTAKAAVDKMLKAIPPDPLAEKTAALVVRPQTGQAGAPKGKAKKR